MSVRVNLSAGFGEVQASGIGWLQLARDAESIGYEHLSVADNNDFRHPVIDALT